MKHDVVVVGGGLVGLTLACALGREGVRVALVEARERRPLARDGIDLRTSAINPVSERILRGIGAWARLPASRLGPFEEMRVWDRDPRSEIHFEAVEADLPRLGYIVENRELVEALECEAETLSTVRLYRPATLDAMECGPHTAALTVSGTRIEARLVAGADGAHSRVRELCGIQAEVASYDQDALVATVRTAMPHRHTAWQRFLADGPLAFLPLPDNWSSVVWSTRPERALELEQADEQFLCNALTDAFEARLGPVREVAGRGRFPLARVKARRYLAHRVALLGDAAHTIHPLAGQGVNLGLLDAAVLSHRVSKLIEAGRDPGLEGNLRTYERWRRGHNLLTGEVMTGFHYLFGSALAPVAAARNLGFAFTNRMPPLKRAFINYASGFSSDLPPLAL